MDDIFKLVLNQAAVEEVKTTVGLQDLVKELHVVYGVYPYKVMEKGKVSLIYPNGLYFGIAEATINSKSCTVYGLKHDKIKKERACRNLRLSTSLKVMVKILRKEIPTTRPSIYELKGNLNKIYARIMSAAHSAMKVDHRPSLYLRDYELTNLALHHIDGNILSQEVYDKMAEYRQELYKVDRKIAEYRERLTCFENIYLLYTSSASPTIFAEMKKVKHNINGKIEDFHVPVDDWRIVKDVDDLPDEALSMFKMWELANEKRIINNRPWGIENGPLNRFLVNSDDFYQESDVVTRYDSSDGYRDYFTAIAKGPSDERSN